MDTKLVGLPMIEDHRNVEKILNSIYQAALLDHSEGIAEYDYGRNAGPSLERRLKLRQYRPEPRRGDSHKYRGMYQAIRFFLKTDKEG